MKYELAKKLKDAGFPQDMKQGDEFFMDKKRTGFYGEYDCDGALYPWGDGLDGTGACIKKPSLSELISACEEEFYGVMKDGLGWIAKAGDSSTSEIQLICVGKTPEEAVNKLWRQLNKKK